MKSSPVVNIHSSELVESLDVIFVGAGLSSSLFALFLKARRPDIKIRIFESASEMHLEKTWSFHHTDLTIAQLEVLKPLISKTWQGYEVQFPNSRRVLETRYSSIRPAKLQHHLQSLMGHQLQFDSPVATVSSHQVQLQNGKRFSAPCVIDGRGLTLSDLGPCGFQKFVGLHVELNHPHGLQRPVLMDATVEQIDGYRFIYTLPWGPKDLLIEDTRYSNTSKISVVEYTKEIHDYAQKKGWSIRSVRSFEKGVLPIPLKPVQITAEEQKDVAPRIGMAGGFFHPVTGYSLPDAARLAEECAALQTLTSHRVEQVLIKARKIQFSDHAYFCFLNRMMFEAAQPEKRFRIFERFYSLNQKLIGRFYQGSLPLRDKLRIVMGSPPVPVLAAARCLWRPTL